MTATDNLALRVSKKKFLDDINILTKYFALSSIDSDILEMSFEEDSLTFHTSNNYSYIRHILKIDNTYIGKIIVHFSDLINAISSYDSIDIDLFTNKNYLCISDGKKTINVEVLDKSVNVYIPQYKLDTEISIEGKFELDKLDNNILNSDFTDMLIIEDRIYTSNLSGTIVCMLKKKFKTSFPIAINTKLVDIISTFDKVDKIYGYRNTVIFTNDSTLLIIPIISTSKRSTFEAQYSKINELLSKCSSSPSIEFNALELKKEISSILTALKKHKINSVDIEITNKYIRIFYKNIMETKILCDFGDKVVSLYFGCSISNLLKILSSTKSIKQKIKIFNKQPFFLIQDDNFDIIFGLENNSNNSKRIEIK